MPTCTCAIVGDEICLCRDRYAVRVADSIAYDTYSLCDCALSRASSMVWAKLAVARSLAAAGEARKVCRNLAATR